MYSLQYYPRVHSTTLCKVSFDYPIESVSWDGDVYQVSESKIAHRLEGDDTTLNWFLHLHFLMTQVVISVRKQTFERKQRRITAWISTSDAMMYWFYGCLWILWLLVGKFWPQPFAHRITSLPTKSVKAVDSDWSASCARAQRCQKVVDPKFVLAWFAWYVWRMHRQCRL